MWNRRSILTLLWPLIVEQVLIFAMGAIDTIMVASVGEAAVSGVNIVDNINHLFIIAFTALSGGGAIVASQYIGRKDQDNARTASRQLYYVVVLAAVLVMVPAMIGRRAIIQLLYGAVQNDVMEAASIYLLFTAASYPFLGIYNACAALVGAQGNSKVPMRVTFIVNCINIAGNAFLIYGLKFGVEGAAIATLSSRIIAASILTVMLLRSNSFICLKGLARIKLNRGMIRRIFNIGVPGGLESSMFMIGRLLTQRIFVNFGTIAIAGNAIASVINSFSFMIGNAFGLALITIVGQCIGAGEYDQAKRNTVNVMGLSWLILFVLSAIVFFFMDPIIQIFGLSSSVNEITKEFLSVHCISMAIGWSFSFALPCALRAAGDVRYVMIVSVISMFAARVSFSYLLTFAFGLGPLGVWIAMGMDFIARGTCFIWRWNSGKWREKKVI